MEIIEMYDISKSYLGTKPELLTIKVLKIGVYHFRIEDRHLEEQRTNPELGGSFVKLKCYSIEEPYKEFPLYKDKNKALKDLEVELKEWRKNIEERIKTLQDMLGNEEKER